MLRSIGGKLVCVGAGLLLVTAAVRGQGSGPIAKNQVAPVVAAIGDLTRALDNLQDTLLENQLPGQPRGIYRMAIGLQNDLFALQLYVNQGAPREDLLFQYGKVEKKVGELLAVIDGLGAADQVIRRTARRIRAGDDELHFAVTGGGTAALLKQALPRQGRSLLAATVTLQQNVAYGIDDQPALAAGLKGLVQVTAVFNEQLAANPENLDGVKAAFAKVLTAWGPVVGPLNNLPAREYVYLMRSAGRVDQLQERLFRLLKMSGKRTRLAQPQTP